MTYEFDDVFNALTGAQIGEFGGQIGTRVAGVMAHPVKVCTNMRCKIGLVDQKQIRTGDSGKQMDTLGMSETGMQLCFCRLKEDPKRTKEDVDQLAGQWKSLLMTGGADETVYAVDEGMILISMDASRLREIREFVLGQPQAHGFESGGKIWVLAGEDDDGRPTYAVEPPPSSRPPPPPPKRAKRKKAKKRRAGTHGEL